MRIIPVLDLMNGIVVRGVGGRRAEYRPIVSCWTRSTKPRAVATALLDAYRPREIYVADLDAIGGREPVWPRLADLPVDLWIDAGVRTITDVRGVLANQALHAVIGLETAEGPDVVTAAIEEYGAERVVFSLDLKGRSLLGRFDQWGACDETDWASVADRVAKLGIRRLILLDLAKVGEGQGTGTEAMCRAIKARHPHLEIICGGGVRDGADLERLEKHGAAAVLVASALHDGRIKPTSVP